MESFVSEIFANSQFCELVMGPYCNLQLKDTLWVCVYLTFAYLIKEQIQEF